MTTMINMYTHTATSKGGAALSASLGIKRIKHKNSKYKGNPRKVVINWGASELPAQLVQCRIINPTAAVKNASDKVLCFERMAAKGVTIPETFTDRQKAIEWMREKAGRVLVCRKLTKASAGTKTE